MRGSVVDGGKDPGEVAPHPITSSPEDGALAPGGEISVWSLSEMRYLLQYFTVGLLYGGLPATVYPLMLGYLAVPGKSSWVSMLFELNASANQIVSRICLCYSRHHYDPPLVVQIPFWSNK